MLRKRRVQYTFPQKYNVPFIKIYCIVWQIFSSQFDRTMDMEDLEEKNHLNNIYLSNV